MATPRRNQLLIAAALASIPFGLSGAWLWSMHAMQTKQLEDFQRRVRLVVQGVVKRQEYRFSLKWFSHNEKGDSIKARPVKHSQQTACCEIWRRSSERSANSACDEYCDDLLFLGAFLARMNKETICFSFITLHPKSARTVCPFLWKRCLASETCSACA